jgi:hypothetical protein
MGLLEKTTEAETKKLTTERAAAEDTIAKFQKEVNMWNDELAFLSKIREKMARTASESSTLARRTKEELKVKEL